MDRFQLQRLRDLPIEGVAERLGLRVSRHKCLCPFHDDHHASLSFNMRRNSFRCFVCDAHGGTIDLVMRHLGKDFVEACRWLADSHNMILDEWKPSTAVEKKAPAFDPSRYERFFLRPWLSAEARRFLFDERRIDPRVVSWCRITSWRDRHGVDWLQTPYYDVEGRLIGVQNRRLKSPCVLPASQQVNGSTSNGNCKSHPSVGDSEGAPRFRFPLGSRCGIYNLPVLKRLRPGEQLYITEGCSDCWAMLSAGHKAIAIPSATLLSPTDRQLLSSLSSSLSPSWHMYPDRDAPGERLFLQLKEILPDLRHHHLPPDCKDFSDYYVLKTISH